MNRERIAMFRVYERQLLCIAERVHQLMSYDNLHKVEAIELDLLIKRDEEILREYNSYRDNNGYGLYRSLIDKEKVK